MTTIPDTEIEALAACLRGILNDADPRPYQATMLVVELLEGRGWRAPATIVANTGPVSAHSFDAAHMDEFIRAQAALFAHANGIPAALMDPVKETVPAPAAPEVAGGGAEAVPWVCPDCHGSTRDAGGMNEEAPEPCMRCFAHWQDSQPAPAPVAAAAPGVTAAELADYIDSAFDAHGECEDLHELIAEGILAKFTLTKKVTT